MAATHGIHSRHILFLFVFVLSVFVFVRGAWSNGDTSPLSFSSDAPTPPAVEPGQTAHAPIFPWGSEPPDQPRTLYLLHHTHLDIGYTHTQEEVRRIQGRHLDEALRLIAATESYPEGTRFCWLPEALWAFSSYWEQASPEVRSTLRHAIEQKRLGWDALFCNELTALCHPEELVTLLSPARRLAKAMGIEPPRSAMITDVPGYTWGIVATLAQAGVRYFSIGPNLGHRIGYTLKTWGDKPFYWESPDGKYRVLCWVSSKGYSWCFEGLPTLEQRIQQYDTELREKQFPYPIAMLRYSIRSDNGPPDEGIADFVKAWNERGRVPRLVLSTTEQAFEAFERCCGEAVPHIRGDFTPYWEDGAASSARETALTRNAVDRLVQAQLLWTQFAPSAFPEDRFRAAWESALLYNEHTWGAWNSISDPHAPLVTAQWEYKQRFALDADGASRELLASSLQALPGYQTATPTEALQAVWIFNTAEHTQTQLVTIPADRRTAGDRVVDEGGMPVPSQRLSDGSLSFLAENIPGLCGKIYCFQAGESARPSRAVQITMKRLTNGLITISLDRKTGALRTLNTANGRYLSDELPGTGQAVYVAGRDPKSAVHSRAKKIRIVEAGPLVGSVEVSLDLPTCRTASMRYTLVAGIPSVECVFHVDKEAVYTPESLHVAFATAFKHPDIYVSLPWAVAKIPDEQLPGACRNYLTVQRWVLLNESGRSLVWVTPDAPLIEVGDIRVDAPRVRWLQELTPSGRLYSYVMNNYWETNYRAAQDGPHTFRYRLCPSTDTTPEQAEQMAGVYTHPFVVIPWHGERENPIPLFMWKNPSLHLVSTTPLDSGRAILFRIWNMTNETQPLLLEWPRETPRRMLLTDPYGDNGREISEPLTLSPREWLTVRVEF